MSIMSIQDVRDFCREVDESRYDDNVSDIVHEASVNWLTGMMLALDIDHKALCFSCRGCENPACVYLGMSNDTLFQFRMS